MGNIGVSRCVDDALGKDGLASRLVLHNDPSETPAITDHVHGQRMEQWPDPALNKPVIGHDLEHLTIDGVAQRLGFRPRAAEAFGPLLEFDANPFDVDGPSLPVPGDAFHAHVRQIAAETAVTLHNHRLDAGPRRADRGGQASQGNGILSQALNRTFSRYSSLKAHFSRLVSIPRRHSVSRFSDPSTNRRITLMFAAAWPVRTRHASSLKLTSSCQCSSFSMLQWPRTASANSFADNCRLRM